MASGPHILKIDHFENHDGVQHHIDQLNLTLETGTVDNIAAARNNVLQVMQEVDPEGFLQGDSYGETVDRALARAEAKIPKLNHSAA